MWTAGSGSCQLPEGRRGKGVSFRTYATQRFVVVKTHFRRHEQDTYKKVEKHLEKIKVAKGGS